MISIKHNEIFKINASVVPYWIGTGFYVSVLKSNTMAKSSGNRSHDRSKVAGGQDYELQYETGKTGASKDQIKKRLKLKGTKGKK